MLHAACLFLLLQSFSICRIRRYAYAAIDVCLRLRLRCLQLQLATAPRRLMPLPLPCFAFFDFRHAADAAISPSMMPTLLSICQLIIAADYAARAARCRWRLISPVDTYYYAAVLDAMLPPPFCHDFAMLSAS